MSMTPNEGRQRGQKRAERGIKAAAYNHKWDIKRDQLKLLRLFLADPSRTATTDDIVENLAKKFGDGGKWRGEVPKGLARKNAIRCVGFPPSCRPSRHGTPVREWAIADIHAARHCLFELEGYFRSNPVRPEPSSDVVTDIPSSPTLAKPESSLDDKNGTSPLAL
ncbi:MAG: hypothetical protein NT013_24640 [Planctomycetia bacterium]|nr:hypothetical protein [Planctomycetia bacterium]